MSRAITLVVLFFLAGCAGIANPDAGSSPGAECSVDRDCPTGARCLFPANEICPSTGHCYAPPSPRQCGEIAIVRCGCDGRARDVNICPYPSTLSPVPLAHDGRCLSDAATTE